MLSLLSDLVNIPSLTGDEGKIADFLTSFLKNEGFTVELWPIHPGSERRNIYAYFGSTRTNKFLFTTHIDTVPPFIPFSGPDANQNVFGRGTCDAKGAAVVQIQAAKELFAESVVKEGDLALLLVVGEEIDGVGMKNASKMGLKWENIVFGEPTEGKLALGHKGILLLELSTTGKACHSGYPHLGSSANHALIPILKQFLDLELPTDSKLGPSTINIGTMHGGEAPNILSPSASATISIRVSTSFETIKTSALRILSEHPSVSYKILAEYPPPRLYSDVPGFETINVGFGTDIPFLEGHDVDNVKRFLYGPGSIFVAHTSEEFVSLGELEACKNGYKKLVAQHLHVPSSGSHS
ncbi:Zn-dependent exopeptidase [Dendrothele bispora CBS 962.96]|uniref:Zn-dependent exopeptidase n=1 Tax=Dendrothele bispora (strain CBS 962.96) TaxID=1314807 RepID=A0A4S8M9D3_DENBC|nr:Zn-dependent exopeptidase [Dendrothele bispora CBS 962.96]